MVGILPPHFSRPSRATGTAASGAASGRLSHVDIGVHGEE